MALAANHAAPEIEAAVMQHQRAMNASRFIPDTPEIYRRVSEQNRLYIFNVGPWPHVRELGSAGTFRIPACLPDREYSVPVVVNGVVEEPYPINEVECKIIPTEGAALAGQIIGVGPHVPPNASFVPYGVFISETLEPSPKATAAAREQLHQQHVKHIREANEAYLKDPTNKDGIIQSAWHFVSAHALRKTKAECPWLGESTKAAARDNCPGCGEVYNVGILRHTCGWFFDKAKWEANQNGQSKK